MKQILTKIGDVIKVSDEDYEELSKHSWHKNGNGYAETTVWRKNTRNPYHIQMHRLILFLTNSKVQADHINGDRLDNRRENLRIVTNKENSRNRTVKSHSKSGFYGVYFMKVLNKYRAFISPDKKFLHIGLFDTAEEAALAYNKKAEELGFLTRNVF